MATTDPHADLDRLSDTYGEMSVRVAWDNGASTEEMEVAFEVAAEQELDPHAYGRALERGFTHDQWLSLVGGVAELKERPLEHVRAGVIPYGFAGIDYDRAIEAGATGDELRAAQDRIGLMPTVPMRWYVDAREKGYDHNEFMADFGIAREVDRRVGASLAQTRLGKALVRDYGEHRARAALEAGATPEEARSAFNRLTSRRAGLYHYATLRAAGATHEQVVEALDAVPLGQPVDGGLSELKRSIEAGRSLASTRQDRALVNEYGSRIGGRALAAGSTTAEAREAFERLAAEGLPLTLYAAIREAGASHEQWQSALELVDAAAFEAAETYERSPGPAEWDRAEVVGHYMSVDGNQDWYVIGYNMNDHTVLAAYTDATAAANEVKFVEWDLDELEARAGDRQVLRDVAWERMVVNDVDGLNTRGVDDLEFSQRSGRMESLATEFGAHHAGRALYAGATVDEAREGFYRLLDRQQPLDRYAEAVEAGIPHSQFMNVTDPSISQTDAASNLAGLIEVNSASPSTDDDVTAQRRRDTLAADYGPNRTARALSAAGGDALAVREGFELLDGLDAPLGLYADAREAGASHERVVDAIVAMPDEADHHAGLTAFIGRVEAGAPPVDEEWVWNTNHALAGRSERDHDLIDGQLLQAADLDRSSGDERYTGTVTAHLHSADGLEDWHIVELDRDTGVVGAWYRCDSATPVYQTDSLQELAKRGDEGSAVVVRDQDWKPRSVAFAGCAVHAQQAATLEVAAERVQQADARSRPAGEIDQAFDVWADRLGELGAGPHPPSGEDLATMVRIGGHAGARADELVPVLERQASERAVHPAGVTSTTSTSMGVGR